MEELQTNVGWDDLMELGQDMEAVRCRYGLEPHQFEVEDFAPEQADLVCVKCGKKT